MEGFFFFDYLKEGEDGMGWLFFSDTVLLDSARSESSRQGSKPNEGPCDQSFLGDGIWDFVFFSTLLSIEPFFSWCLLYIHIMISEINEIQFFFSQFVKGYGTRTLGLSLEKRRQEVR